MSPGFVALIPARAGSRGIPHKNTRNFLGRPLLVWAIDIAIQSGCFDEIILSTDSNAIADVARSAGLEVQFLRPPELAEDMTPTADVVRHALDWRLKKGLPPVENVVVLEPTSPARTIQHVRTGCTLLADSSIESVASVSRVPHHFAPSKILRMTPEGDIAGLDGTPVSKMIHRRQDLSEHYSFNGIFFGSKTHLPFRTPPTLWGDSVKGFEISSRYAIDLDEPDDWVTAEHTAKTLREESDK